MMNIKNIYWVRHAESCSNKQVGSIEDKEPDNYNKPENIGYYPKKYNLSKNYQDDNIRTIYDIYPDILNQPWVTSNTRISKDIIRLFNAGLRRHPNITYVGMNQAILLGMNYMRNLVGKNILGVYVSASVRTIMTALLSLRGLDQLVINVTPYLSESTNIIDKHVYDYQNQPVDIKILRRAVLFIKEWLRESWIKYYDDIELLINLNKLKTYPALITDIDDILDCKKKYNNCQDKILDNLNKLSRKISSMRISEDLLNYFSMFDYKNKDKLYKYLAGPEVSFKILQEYEDKNYRKEVYPDHATRFNNFYTKILPKINHENIIVYTHGAILRDVMSRRYQKITPRKNTYNTQVYREDLEKSRIYYNEYLPVPVRYTFGNLERLNYDLCDQKSMLGMINYPIWDDRYKYLISNMNPDIKNLDVNKYYDIYKKRYQEEKNKMHL